jgi:D-beta-D-heptose 7-phosphate kinase/D-beta-D-heptose 1-phosphate adenosyltransferase
MSNIPEISQVTPKTIWVNGCFDVIHAGHIDMIKYAKSLGQILVVGLDTDKRVQSNKGLSRPINTLALRIKVMESIRFVDHVVSFGSDDELMAQIRASNADTIVVGEEYKDHVIGSKIVENVVFYPRKYGLSTTSILSK